MSKQHVVWLSGLFIAAAWLESCGAMTLEPGVPDEPVVTPVRPPRLVRRDAGSDGATRADDDPDVANKPPEDRP
jgi:hypothetical protein